MAQKKQGKRKGKRVGAKDILKELTVQRKSMLDAQQTQKGILDELLFQRNTFTKPEQKPKANWVKWVERFELLLIIGFFYQLIVGNGLVGINLLVVWGLVRVIRVIFQNYFGDKSEDLNFTLTGVGAFALGLFALSGSLAIYNLDGTESCTEPFFGVFNDDNSFSVPINDLSVRLDNEKRSWIGVTTKVIADGNFSCEDCSVGPYPKPDGNPDEKERLIQHTTTKLNFPAEVKKFLFVQQLRFWDGSLSFLSDVSMPVRACECEISSTGEVNCDHRLISEWGFPPFPAVYSIDFEGQTHWLWFLGTKWFSNR